MRALVERNSSFTGRDVCYNECMQVKSVSQVTRYIKTLFDSDPELAAVWIEGEISNFSKAPSGHWYFTLKDAEAELRCAMWRSYASRVTWGPQQGDWVDAHGSISVYERGGVYQFYVVQLQRAGVGLRWQQYLELKARLEAEGLFDAARKRPLPRWPRRIGVVTSPQGAAYQDILRVLRKRYPLAEVVLAPSLVQGAEAPRALVRALRQLERLGDIDVILLARGGGSIEDLWAFNDEGLARAVAASTVPVVTGVGHETDFTIVDFVADLRAPTPTAAAALVVPDIEDLRQQVEARQHRLGELIGQRLAHWRSRLAQQERLLHLHDPRRRLAEERQRVDDLVRRASAAMERRISLARARLSGQLSRLRALDPRAVLQRGYAVVQDLESGQRITVADQTAPGGAVRVYLYRGSLDARVTAVHSDSPLTHIEEA